MLSPKAKLEQGSSGLVHTMLFFNYYFNHSLFLKLNTLMYFIVTSKVLKGEERKSCRGLLQWEISSRGSCRIKSSIYLPSPDQFKAQMLQVLTVVGPSAALC